VGAGQTAPGGMRLKTIVVRAAEPLLASIVIVDPRIERHLRLERSGKMRSSGHEPRCSEPRKAAIPSSFLEPPPRSWSHFVGIDRQNLTNTQNLTCDRALKGLACPRPNFT